FVRFAWPMLIQSSFLIAAIFLLDRLLRTRARAALRYCLWLLVLAKLLLPASLAAPTGVGYWIGGEFLSPTPPAIPSEPAPVPAPPAITLDNPPAGPALAPQNPPAISPIAPPPAPSAESPLSPAPPVVAAPPHVAPVPPIIIPPVALSWRAYVLLAWSAVAVAMGLLVIQRTWFIGSLVAGAGEAGGELHSLLAACRQRVGLRRPVGLKLSAGGGSPAVCGLWRPVILIPAHLVGALGPRQMEAVLLHELAHVKRGDLWVNALQVLLQIAYFYNPFLWLANAALRRVREQAVDEAVQVALGDAAVDYPAALVDVARLSLSRPALSLRLIGVVESRGALESRIRRLLSRPLPRTAKLGLTGLLFVLAAAAILLPMAKGQFGPERGPLGGLFEYGPSSGEGLTLKVGPNTFSLRAVARRLDAGPVRAEDGRGRSVSMKGLAWPVFPVHRRADQPTDAVAFYLEPDVSRFDIIEPRVFDHLSREILNGKAGIQISAGVDGVISIQSTGGALPDRVDLWLRAHSYAQDNLPVILAASEGAAVQLGKSRIKLAALRGDVTGVTKVNYQPGHTAHSGYDILWQTNPSGARNDEFFVVFEQSGTWDLGQYQVCAVDKNGFKHFAGSPHYIDFTKNGGPEIIVFRIPLANLDHFEWRPFGGRHRFFFDGVRLPTDGKPRAQPWQVALPCGATVELIGLSESPSQGKPWWRPDGSPLAEAPYAKMGAKAFPQENQVARECAIRLSNLPNESVGSRWEFRSGSYSGGSPVNADGKSIDDLRAIALTTSAAADRITIRYGDGNGAAFVLNPRHRFLHLTSCTATTVRGLSVDFDPLPFVDGTVVAVDKAGKQTLAGRSVGASVGAVRQITSTFPGLRLADVKEFQFQVRPYAWAQFKDIALRPATQPAAGLIPALIGQLGSASAKEREEAQKTLVEIGEPAIDSLRLATADKDLERAARAKEALRLISAQGDNAKLDQFRTGQAPCRRRGEVALCRGDPEPCGSRESHQGKRNQLVAGPAGSVGIGDERRKGIRKTVSRGPSHP
ncbi:MAG: M56 family metallopeptidase, partial [Planctomycetota bacterium]|nr:M56 family metallopeptidase [Planctomycetota bacterium]